MQLRSAPFLVFLALSSPAFSQKLLHTHIGDANQLRLGQVLSAGGDVDGDGFGDYLLGMPAASPNGGSSGEVRIHSGVTGALIRTLDGAAATHEFGGAIAGVGDLNGDGFDDVLVGAVGAGVAGEATLHSGATGAVLRTHIAASPSDSYGYSVAVVGDVDNDGFQDYAVTAPLDNTGPNQVSGAVRVYSGVTGVVLFTTFGDAHMDRFGECVAGVGDVTGDGIPDLLVGATWDDDGGSRAGSANLVSGATGAIVWRFHGEGPGDELGGVLDGAGADIDGDGVADVVVGTVNDDYAYVLRGQSGAPIRRHDGSLTSGGCATYGRGLCALGDVDADGRGDYVIGDTCAHLLGQAYLYSGATGDTIHVLTWIDQGHEFGKEIARLGDLTGDGRDEFGVSATGFDIGAFGNAGRVGVYSPALPIGTRYCSPANAGSSGRPAIIQAYGSPLVSENCLSLTVNGLPIASFGYFIGGTGTASATPPGALGTVCVGGSNIARFNSTPQIVRGPTGSIEIDVQAIPGNPPQPVLPGETWNFQCWFRDSTPAGVATSNFSDAVGVTFQ